jgi:hypothetical protein
LHYIPGCGNTKVIYNAIQTLLAEHDIISGLNEALVAYFCCARNPAEPARENPEEAARCLLKQMSTTGIGSVRASVLQEFRKREQRTERRWIRSA